MKLTEDDIQVRKQYYNPNRPKTGPNYCIVIGGYLEEHEQAEQLRQQILSNQKLRELVEDEISTIEKIGGAATYTDGMIQMKLKNLLERSC